MRLNALIWKVYFIVALTVIGLAGVWYYYSWLRPYDPLVVHNSPLPCMNSPLRAGDEAIFDFEFTKNTNNSGRAYKSLVNTFIVNLPESQELMPRGYYHCRISLLVPLHIAPGRYYICWLVKYKMNPVRTIEETFRTQEFDVIK